MSRSTERNRSVCSKGMRYYAPTGRISFLPSVFPRNMSSWRDVFRFSRLCWPRNSTPIREGALSCPERQRLKIPKVSIILSTDLTRQGISGVDEISKLDYLFPEGTESLQDLQAGRFRDRLERQIWWCISLRTMAAYIAQKSVLKGFFNSKWEGTLSNCIECFWSSVFVVQHLRVLFKVVPRLVILNRDITLSQGGWTISSCLTELGSFIYCRGCACNSGMTGQGVIPHGKIQSRKFTVTFFHMWLGFQEKRFWKSIWYTCTRGLQLHK